MNDLKNKYVEVAEENICLKVKENLPPNFQIESKAIYKNSFDSSLIKI